MVQEMLSPLNKQQEAALRRHLTKKGSVVNLAFVSGQPGRVKVRVTMHDNTAFNVLVEEDWDDTIRVRKVDGHLDVISK